MVVGSSCARSGVTLPDVQRRMTHLRFFVLVGCMADRDCDGICSDSNCGLGQHWCCSSGVGQEQPGSRTAWQMRKLKRATQRSRRLRRCSTTKESSSERSLAQSKTTGLREVREREERRRRQLRQRNSTHSPRERLQLHNGYLRLRFVCVARVTLRPAIFCPLSVAPHDFLNPCLTQARFKHLRTQSQAQGATWGKNEQQQRLLYPSARCCCFASPQMESVQVLHTGW